MKEFFHYAIMRNGFLLPKKTKLLILFHAVLMLISFSATATNKTEGDKVVTGKVKDINGNPVANVTVTVKGSKVSTLTNDEGYYQIIVLDDNAVLIFSHTTYQTTELMSYFNWPQKIYRK